MISKTPVFDVWLSFLYLDYSLDKRASIAEVEVNGLIAKAMKVRQKRLAQSLHLEAKGTPRPDNLDGYLRKRVKTPDIEEGTDL